jgi:hypothetical protein
VKFAARCGLLPCRVGAEQWCHVDVVHVARRLDLTRRTVHARAGLWESGHHLRSNSNAPKPATTEPASERA